MGLRKAGTSLTQENPIKGEVPVTRTPESGPAAAIGRLTTPKAETTAAKSNAYKPRDFDAEARGKTRCVQFQSALESPAIAGMKFSTMEQYLKLVREAADAGVKYTFGE